MVFSSMKKRTLLNLITESTQKQHLTNMNEDSYYDGHKFVEYGKNIENISLIMPSTDDVEYSIKKNSLVINWGLKFEFRNAGIEGVQISVLDLEADLVTTNLTVDDEQEVKINFAEYKFNVIKEKNVENSEIQIFITSIEVDMEQRIVNVTVSI